MTKHFKVIVLQTKEKTVFDIFAENKEEALIDYMNEHHNKEKGFVVTFAVKEVK